MLVMSHGYFSLLQWLSTQKTFYDLLVFQLNAQHRWTSQILSSVQCCSRRILFKISCVLIDNNQSSVIQVRSYPKAIFIDKRTFTSSSCFDPAPSCSQSTSRQQTWSLITWRSACGVTNIKKLLLVLMKYLNKTLALLNMPSLRLTTMNCECWADKRVK